MTQAGPPAPFIFVIAGEPSGDALGAALIAALRRRVGDDLRVAGIGGEGMREQGVESLVPLADLAVGGLVEVLPRAPLILRHIRAAAAAILAARPDAVVTIDSSSFTWRIAKSLRRHSERPALIHYVAPMVWAWRAGRAQKMAQWYDRLLALLPFEPPYFERAEMPCSYVGHPVIESGAGAGDAGRFRAAHGIPPEALVLTVLPGSRAGEVTRLMPIFAAALRLVHSRTGDFRVAVPTVQTVAGLVEAGVREWPGAPIVVHDNEAKYDAFAASRAALAASGTVALELAMARVPMAIAYRLNVVTEMLLDRLLRVRQVNLINLILGRELVREHLRDDCTPDKLAATLVTLIQDETVRAAHREGYDAAMRLLGGGGMSPSLKAADAVLETIAARRRQRP
ncbi:MAG: lipid-A-disaccharide synthase [Alphaproteobacteria bacterium]|nr:lipid-A-disaccharide synthase [Alphaproteobacteria bacterium]